MQNYSACKECKNKKKRQSLKKILEDQGLLDEPELCQLQSCYIRAFALCQYILHSCIAFVSGSECPDQTVWSQLIHLAPDKVHFFFLTIKY